MSTSDDDRKPETPEAATSAASFATLGQYVQGFEEMVESIRLGCWTMLGGRSEGAIVIYNQVFTAMPLAVTFRALVLSVTDDPMFAKWDRNILVELLAHLQSSIQQSVEKRNALLHGTWYIGQYDLSQDEHFAVKRVKITGKGLEQERPAKRREELILLRVECARIRRFTKRLMDCIVFTRSPQPGYPDMGLIQANFARNRNKWIMSEQTA